MDQNQPALINATGSSQISSLTVSFGLLKVDACTGDGPINRLPNEMMQLIMAKLRLDVDVKKLVRLRLVSTRWRAIIEDYCRMKKSLIVLFTGAKPYDMSASCFDYKFFGFAKLNDFTRLYLSTKMPSECLTSMLNLFPNVVHCWEQTRVSDFFAYINTLDSLKLLDLDNFSVPTMSLVTQLSQTLSKLEQFSYGYGYAPGDLQLISHLRPNCVRVHFGNAVWFVYDEIRQWHSLNPTWFANLTHLQMIIRGTSEDCARVVHFLSEHTILLQHLEFETVPNALKLTPTVLESLGKLTHLANLTLGLIELPFSVLEQSAVQHRLTTLTSVLTLGLWTDIDVNDLDYSVYVNQFTRVLSVIFPNLAELEAIFRGVNATRYYKLLVEMDRYLGRFPNLRKHQIMGF